MRSLFCLLAAAVLLLSVSSAFAEEPKTYGELADTANAVQAHYLKCLAEVAVKSLDKEDAKERGRFLVHYVNLCRKNRIDALRRLSPLLGSPLARAFDEGMTADEFIGGLIKRIAEEEARSKAP